MKLMNDGFDSEMIIAGILHDTVEDTDTNIEEIESIFGNRVAHIVLANTKDNTILTKINVARNS